jgi:hypothetical protein
LVTFIAVYHSDPVITSEIGSYEFVGMKETFLLNEHRTLENLVGLVSKRLGWMGEDSVVRFEGRINIESSKGPRMKTMSLGCNEE